MTQYLFEHGNTCSLGSISTEEDSKVSPRPGMSINPPPKDGRCECCRRHVSELPPFGQVGDPLVGDFAGERLVKTWQRMGPYDEEAERIYNTFFGPCDSAEDRKKALARLVQHYGEEKAEAIYGGVQLASTVEAVWLCRDCIVLEEEERLAKRG